MKKKVYGFTLVELLIAISLSAIITTTIIYVLKAGLDSWEYGQGQALCQLTTETAVDRIVEGDYFYDGLREALEITYARETELAFVPWYVQSLDDVEPGEKYRLEKPLLKGVVFPLGEVYNPDTKEFEFRNLEYFLASENMKSAEFIRFDIKKKFRKARIIYYPDPRKDPDVVMRIRYDPGKKMIFRTYLGKEKALFRGERNIVSLKMRYFDSSNNVLVADKMRKVQLSHYKKSFTTPITAVEVVVIAESGSETFTLISFVNIRKKGMAGSGVYLTENAKVPIPDSANVKILSLTNFGGITGASRVEILISSEESFNQSYLLRLNFDNINGIEYLQNYVIEYPRGEIVLTKNLERPAYSGLSFLALDPSGHYDYDDDESIEDFVIFEGQDIILSVEKMEIGGMTLYVR